MDEALTPKKKNRLTRVMFGPMAVPNYVLVKVLQQLPPDTVVIRTYLNEATQQWGWVMASEKFEEVKQGGEIPKLVVKSDLTTKTVEVHVPLPPENFLDELLNI